MSYLQKLLDKYCPDGYEWVTLGEISSIRRGASPRPISSFLSKEGYPWIKIGDIEEGKIYLKKTKQFINEKGSKKSVVVDKGDLILSNSMSFGKPVIADIKGCIHDGWLLIANFEKNVTSKFLYYWFLSNYSQSFFLQQSSPGTISNLNSEILKKLKIPLIPLKIQEKIVEILERFRILEAELKAELEARGKQFDFTLTKIFNFKQYKLKKLWEITFWDKNFQEVEKFKQSKTSNFKYLFYKEIENYNDPKGDVKIITTGKEENLKINSKNYKKDIYSGEVLLIPGGGEANIKYHKGKFVTGDNRIGQVLNKNEVATKFLYYYFLLNLDLIRKNFRGGSIKHPFMKNILELNIPIPPLETQNKIVSILDKLSEYSQEINLGLPAEIELRSKQFKYYRDQLLDFK
ncbi:hypothetical protein MBIO_0853 [Mycoplasmopsis fermentans PG18]|uniref:Type I restriction modification DNA specificity domain-containing protein n=1 Tax=Mycoplasmopsis fermentans (strain ATCC 19989 / NBRC 14854 / NCTC 10117 / PG18) TaxID=496833 RepID=C4XG46_MYCFP|nr:restriction endonuclease subunit S [Mycoplasmopsis fermentans]BAH70118.1 hypothetical protein MBIO_0853 [Mycoplasmopsis fermentans PG18]VEU63838.1 Type I restriction enzyme specificity protein [Mycoplasmopsis fermentans]VEU67171.1 Type I restriction enzyme specificity protein [Mesomycoplasma conjunctivae]